MTGGTGYNAGLLTHRLGGSNVTSIDVDPACIAHARHALHSLNLSPQLIVGDGTQGVADRAPFDRIIALAPLQRSRCPGSPSSPPRERCWSTCGGRLPGEYEIRPTSERDQNRITTHPTTVIEISRNIDNPDFRFLAQLHIPGIRVLSTVRDPDGVTLHAETTDGSWARASADGRIGQGGNRRLWDSLYAAHTLWCELDHPRPDRFGVVANLSTQFVYLDHDKSWTRWPLPLL